MILDTNRQKPERTEFHLPGIYGFVRHAPDDPALLARAVMRALGYGLIFHRGKLYQFHIDGKPTREIGRQELRDVTLAVLVSEFERLGIRKKAVPSIALDVEVALKAQCLIEGDTELREWLKI